MTRATFVDGPLAGAERPFATAAAPLQLTYARMPDDAGGPWQGRWMLVGMRPGRDPREHWPEVVTYELFGESDDEAFYVLKSMI